MKIRNRIPDIETLQVHILQDFFKMELAVKFSGDEWKAVLLNEIQNGVNSKYSSSYIGAWEKIQLRGIDSYSVDDMDTTIILAILKGKGSFDCCTEYKIKRNFDNLQSDRNFDAHMTGNETASQLLQWAYGALQNIGKFVSSVWKNSHASDEDKLAFNRKYQREIEVISKQLEDDYKESLRSEEIEQDIKRDICAIGASNDPRRTYCDIYGRYIALRNMELSKRFVLTAADEGIIYACGFAGDMYFEGLTTPVDYKKAEEYYSKCFCELTPPQKLNLAGIYINNLSDFHTKEEGINILKSCENHRWKIVTYPTKEGYEFYRIQCMSGNNAPRR